MIAEAKLRVPCFHCGEDCDTRPVLLMGKTFCCEGCKTVYEILDDNNLCNYYTFNNAPGTSFKNSPDTPGYAFLDIKKNADKIISFTDGKQTHVTFSIPRMHCSSCIYLLEHFHKINPGVIRSQVVFQKKEVSIVFLQDQTSLRRVVEDLLHIGYEPHLSLDDLGKKKQDTNNRTQYMKIGIAGFCFGNIMMLSFPEYLSGGEINVPGLKRMFTYINLLLSLPVLLYCSTTFFVSAWKSLKHRYLNIDGPITIAILITFFRSVYEIASGTGAGYLDSMSGIVFFMLIGRTFQDKTFKALSFDRDYKSFFPVSVTLKTDIEKSIAISELKVGDKIIIRNNEMIPADAILINGDANMDYSFVSGESLPVKKKSGDIIYAGGKQSGSSIELEVIKEVSQSYLTSLWNNQVFHENPETKNTFLNKVSNYFSMVVFAIAIGSGIFWFNGDPAKALNAMTSVLIVACPCALLLSSTFTNGTIMRTLGKNMLYLKSPDVIEKLALADTIVFDKTGTITNNGGAEVTYHGNDLSVTEEGYIRTVVSHSTHPLSQAVFKHLSPVQKNQVSSFKEYPYKGIEAMVEGHLIKLGSRGFAGNILNMETLTEGSKVFVSIDGEPKGGFSVRNKYREGFFELAETLKTDYSIFVLSGDNDAERKALSEVFKEDALVFKQTPQDKMNFIQSLQKEGRNVLMVGDGLNDAGALKQSNAGIAVSDDTSSFSPACDAILDGAKLKELKEYLDFSKDGKKVIFASFIISLIYNIAGIFFSVQGTLQPIVAAILMPLSTITIVLFTSGMTFLLAKKRFEKV